MWLEMLLGIRIPRTRWGTGFEHAFIVHIGELNCVICVMSKKNSFDF